MIKVNAMGDACPIPVVKTKNAIRELQGGGTVETLVDNEIAVQNLTKMANQKGYDVHSEKVADNEFKVTMTINAEAAQIAANSAVATIEEENCPITPLNKKYGRSYPLKSDGKRRRGTWKSFIKGIYLCLKPARYSSFYYPFL